MPFVGLLSFCLRILILEPYAELVTVVFVALRAQPVTEISMRVIPDIPLQLHPTAIGSLDLLALHTNRQYSTKTRQLAIPGLIQGALGLDSVCHIDATADIAEELIVLAEERSTPVEYPAIFPIVPS